jgi:hypothetical protein
MFKPVMPTYQHSLWGYELSYPDGWQHRTLAQADGLEAEVFVAATEAFESDYAGPGAGQLAVRAEWNPTREDVKPLWERKIGLLAGWIGARQVGSAPWRLGEAEGLEAEIALPRRNTDRLWTGILTSGFHVLHFMVTHPKDQRPQFEPPATRIITSLRFLTGAAGVELSPEGLPLPPGYTAADPRALVNDIQSPGHWRAYAGTSPVDALQAFYVRAAPAHGWTILEYRPFPQNPDLGFARFQLGQPGANGQGRPRITLGLLPYGQDTVRPNSPANVVFQLS